jgi:hypothetical protein
MVERMPTKKYLLAENYDKKSMENDEDKISENKKKRTLKSRKSESTLLLEENVKNKLICKSERKLRSGRRFSFAMFGYYGL